MRQTLQPQWEPAIRRKNRGFSLIELLIVVAIILIITAIAVPNFMRARMAANESSAAENLRTITTASVVYNTTWDNGFPPSLASMGGSSGAPATCDAAILIDPILAASPSQKSGYSFTYAGQYGTVTAPPGCSAQGFNGYLVSAVPIFGGVTGTRSFCSDTPGVIHYDLTGTPPSTASACDALPGLQ